MECPLCRCQASVIVNKTETGYLPRETQFSPGRLKYWQGLPLPRQIGIEEEHDLGSGLRCLDSYRLSTTLLAPRSWPAYFIFLSLHFIIHKNRKINVSYLIGLWALNVIIYVKCLGQCLWHCKSWLLLASTDCYYYDHYSAKTTPQQTLDVKMGSVYKARKYLIIWKRCLLSFLG